MVGSPALTRIAYSLAGACWGAFAWWSASAAAQPPDGSTTADAAAVGGEALAASDSESIRQARAHFKQGVARFETGDLAGALEQFEQADRLHHAPVVTYNLGRVHESLGHAHPAVEAYERYLAEAGADAEFAGAATVAIAQIKGRSTRLRVNSDPPGAVVRVDGHRLGEPTPTTVWLLRGSHRISVEQGDWQDGRDYEAAGGGAPDEIAFERPAEPVEVTPPPVPVPAPAKRKPTRPSSSRASPAQPAPAGPDGLMGGVGLTLSGFAFVNKADRESSGTEVTTAKSKASGVVFGLEVELGYALGANTAVFGRGFYGAGSSENTLAALGVGGLLLGWRFARDWWLGGGAVAGASRADSDAETHDSSLSSVETDRITYRTDLAFGPMVELSYSLGDSRDGQWLVSLQPGTLFTTGTQESTLFVPLVLGHRWY